MDLEMVTMELVGNAGESRSLSFEALKHAKDGDFEKAKELLEESKKYSLLAHKVQSELIFEEANGKKIELGLLMVHAQDHLMTSILAREIIYELIEIYKNKK
ncbi:MAG: PTS lactose/cellobiose transporter subunit IIA [Fusobacteriaceae bacterium]